MIFVTLILWIITAILVATNREKPIRWVTFLSFLCGLGGFSVVIEESIIPFYVLYSDANAESIISVLQITMTVSSGLAYYLCPWSLLMYGITSLELLSTKWERRITFLTLIPIMTILYLYPTHNHYMITSEEKIHYFKTLSLFAVPYITTGNILLIASVIREKKWHFKKNKLIACIFLVPFFTWAMFAHYLVRAWGIDNSWRYNTVVIILLGIWFLLLIYKYGILGVKFE